VSIKKIPKKQKEYEFSLENRLFPAFVPVFSAFKDRRSAPACQQNPSIAQKTASFGQICAKNL